MNVDLSIIHLVANASVLVQMVMLLLLGISVVSWTMIFKKRRQITVARRRLADFETQFWSGGDLTALYRDVSGRAETSGLEKIFESGFKEFVRLRKQSSADAMSVVEGAQRAMRAELNRETDTLETQLPFLATVGSTSPYIGLFGTVWGIMNSFRALGTVQQATLAMVAPGIAEALIATAMGLFAAIPAVVAYNRYVTEVDRLLNRYQTFVEEFSTILQRQAQSGT